MPSVRAATTRSTTSAVSACCITLRAAVIFAPVVACGARIRCLPHGIRAGGKDRQASLGAGSRTPAPEWDQARTTGLLGSGGGQMIKGSSAGVLEPLRLLPCVVAGAGFEPATSGL